MHQPQKVGFIGLGNMGWPMASRLIGAGFDVTVFDVNTQTEQKFTQNYQCFGATSITQLGVTSEVVITMLPDGKAVQRALLGNGSGDGLVNSMQSGMILIDMSSSSPIDTRKLGRILCGAEIAMVDAPVSGGVSRAEAGTLSIMAGGDRSVLDRCEAIFQVLANKVFYTGGLGSGHAMKALNNLLSAGGLIAAAEILLVGRRFGLDPHTMIEVLNSSTGRNNSTENKFEKFILSRSFASGFSLDLMIKDLTTAVELARDTETPIIFGSLCRELWACARASLGHDLDHTEVVRWFEELSSITLEGGGHKDG